LPFPDLHIAGLDQETLLVMSEVQLPMKLFHEIYSPRFWAKVRRTLDDACWEWQASLMCGGYGAFNWEGKTLKAHRIAWAHEYGEIPEGMNVCHRCDNRICCNPAHLFLGTHLDNARDRNSKGRQARGANQPQAKLTEDRVRAIRADNRFHRDIAKAFGISKALVSFIKCKKAWRHVA
jgi:hypothetical protein